MHHSTALSNRLPILEKLKQTLAEGLPASSSAVPVRAIEVGSGSGAQLEVFAPELKHITWQPTEYVPPVEAQTEEEAFDKYGKIVIGQGFRDGPLEVLDRNLAPFPNVDKAKALDLTDTKDAMERFKAQSVQLVHTGNVLHICPARGTEGLFRFSAHVLSPHGGLVTVYGPFKRAGEFTTESNREFDSALRGKNPDFGLRDIESEVVPAANKYGFRLKEISDMPKNNFFLVFSRL